MKHLLAITKENVGKAVEKHKQVILEPELELIAGHLDAFERAWMAAKLARWVHQLRVSSRVLGKPQSHQPQKLRIRPGSKLVLN